MTMAIKDKKELNSCFLLGFLLGILVFIAIYGVAVLDVAADGWVFKSDNDFRQHYVGWMAYRNSPWAFPLGMTDKLSYPVPMSIVYTDSIPLVSLLFKLISPILPSTFQFFGWYALISFGLTAAFGAKINFRLLNSIGGYDRSTTGNPADRRYRTIAIAVLLSIFYVLSFIMLHRTFYHTSLASQWIILLCFEMWFGGIVHDKLQLQCAKTLLLGILCVGIHTYFLPMALGILFMAYAERYLVERKTVVIRNAAAALGAMVTGAAAFLYIMGAFAVDGQGEYWVGDFTMNLATFFNSMGHSVLLKEMPTYGPMQYEGAAYLGLGLIIGCTIVIAHVIYKIAAAKDKKAFVLGLIKNHSRRISFTVTAVIFMLIAMSPVFAWGDRLLLKVPYTTLMNRVLGIFRSNGRFVWPVFYIIIFALVKKVGEYIAAERKNNIKIAVMVIVCLLAAVQVADFSGWIKEKSDKYKDAQKTYRTVWDEITLPDGYKHFVVFEEDNSFQMQTAYYAMRYGMDQNNFYFARDIDAVIQEGLAVHKANILAGNADEDTIYVFDRETYEQVKNSELHFYMTRKCIFGVKSRIDGMKEVTEQDVELVKWQ